MLLQSSVEHSGVLSGSFVTKKLIEVRLVGGSLHLLSLESMCHNMKKLLMNELGNKVNVKAI